jgi:glycosyltransferase involved in cell wall biosynthesis
MRIRTLLPMACDGVGPSQTCINIVKGMRDAGAEIDVFVNRMRIPRGDLPVWSLLYPPFSKIPYSWIEAPLTRVLENWYLRNINDEDVAYLWPAASLRVHREVYRRSIPIVLEGINSRMKSAKIILDRAYDEFGAPPGHGITEDRILEEEEKLSLATAIFAPNPSVEQAVSDLPIFRGVVPTSYGTHVPDPLPQRASSLRSKGLVFLFCGYACVRKGVHRLLDLWPKMPQDACLRLVGGIEPVITRRYSRLLSSGRIEVTGFVRDTGRQYATSDAFVFPSLEEGGPQVTYEAAAHGLPLVTSAIGAGRLTNAAWIVDPARPDDLLNALESLYFSPQLRREWGERAQAAVSAYDWSNISVGRLRGLAEVLSGHGHRDE